MAGELYDTYVAALQHDLADLRDGVRRVGVVRRPTPWFYGVVDENVPALGPPGALLDAAKERADELRGAGLGDAHAHNRAMEEVDFEAQYSDYLESSPEVAEEIARLRSLLDAGEHLALVCYENTDEKRCHRTILRRHLRSA